MEVEDSTLGSSDAKCELEKNQPPNLMSIEKSLFAISLFEEEDSNLVTHQPNLIKDMDSGRSLSVPMGHPHARQFWTPYLI
jgi:hypothetical protein